MPNIEQAAKVLAMAIWSEHKLTDAAALPIIIEDTVQAILRMVPHIVHDWEAHREVRYVDRGVHKIVKRVTVD